MEGDRELRVFKSEAREPSETTEAMWELGTPTPATKMTRQGVGGECQGGSIGTHTEAKVLIPLGSSAICFQNVTEPQFPPL